MRRLTWHSMFDVPCLLTSPQRKLWASGLLFIFIFTWQLCFLGVWYRNLAVDMLNHAAMHLSTVMQHGSHVQTSGLPSHKLDKQKKSYIEYFDTCMEY